MPSVPANHWPFSAPLPAVMAVINDKGGIKICPLGDSWASANDAARELATLVATTRVKLLADNGRLNGHEPGAILTEWHRWAADRQLEATLPTVLPEDILALLTCCHTGETSAGIKLASLFDANDIQAIAKSGAWLELFTQSPSNVASL